jgi:CheY-like chemotaxis protein
MRPAILYVEDDEDEVFLLRRAFQKANRDYRLSHANRGEEAISYLSGEGRYAQRDKFPLPEVLLLDLKMPGANGFDVLSWLRGQSAFKELPVIMLSSSDRPEDLQRAFDLGATSYLNKSISCENVMGMLDVLLKPSLAAEKKSPALPKLVGL